MALLERVAKEHARLADALGARGLHVFLPQHLQHGRARRARQHRELEEAERDGREQQRLDGRPDPLPPAVEAAGPHPAEPDGEEQDQEQPRPEARDGHAQLGQHHRQIVREPPVSRRREHAERNRRHHHEAAGQQGERQRDLKPREEKARDGHVVLDGSAEVAPERTPDPLGVLDQERAVEPHRLAEPGGGLGAPGGADDDEGGIARQDADDDEDQDRNEEEGGDERRHPSQDVTPHARTRRGAPPPFRTSPQDRGRGPRRPPPRPSPQESIAPAKPALGTGSCRARWARTSETPIQTSSYFCQATSERSNDGIGRSFQMPVTPFLATTSRGCM